MIAPQEDAALVVAMAEQALEDAHLIQGAGLTVREAREWFNLEDQSGVN